MDQGCFNFEKCIKNFPNLEDKINIVIDDYKAKTKTDYYEKKSY